MLHFRFLPLALVTLALAACNNADSGSASNADAAPAAQAVTAPQGTNWSDHVEPTAEGGMRMGNPNAPIKLVEYGSLSCPHCARLAQEGFDKLTNDYVGSGRVSYEFRSMVIHPPQDVPLTLLVNCAAQDAFFPLVHQIYSNFDDMEKPLDDAAVRDKANAVLQGPPEGRLTGLSDVLGFTRFFSARGLTVEKAHACLADMAAAKRITDFTDQYVAEGIDGTPALFINGNKVDTVQWAVLETALRNAGAR